MEQLVAKMQEYLKMDTDIPFAEFNSYHQQVIDFLMKQFAELDKDGLVQMVGICQVITLNAKNRASYKDTNMKKFRKIADKEQFWVDAINYKLETELAMSKEDIDAAVEALWQD